MDIALRDGLIADFAQDVQACALAQASAALLGQGIIGESAASLRAARDALAAMMKKGATPPEGKWSVLSALQPVRDYPPRHDSVLLPFEAACAALEKAGE